MDKTKTESAQEQGQISIEESNSTLKKGYK